LAAAVAVICVIGLLVYDRRQARSSSLPDRLPGNGTQPHVLKPPPGTPLPKVDSESSQSALDAFVANASGRGAGAVPLLMELLRGGEDATFMAHWKFRDGELEGHPTLRAAYIEALRAIRDPEAAEALAELLKLTTSPNESYLVALALKEKGKTGWSRTLLELANSGEDARHLGTRRAMVQLAARDDPVEAARYIYLQAPRGTDRSVPRLLAEGLSAMPMEDAAAAAGRLLLDPDVTEVAKGQYVRSLCRRSEVEAFSALRGLAERGELDDKIRLDTAYAMAGSGVFRMDAITYQKAMAEGRQSDAADIRARFDRRIEEVQRYASAALSLDLDSSTDPRAAALRKHLDDHRKAFGQR
jgi:hypothetical protein